ncbi:MAG: hydroxyacylglutathione hydrolase [Polyangiales bacterium]
MLVHVIPCLSDNYAYLVVNESSGAAVVVDPSEEGPVRRALEVLGVELVGVLATHHHWDHVGGVEALLAWRPSLEVWAHASDRGRVPGQTGEVAHGESISLGGMDFRALHVPGHTLGAVTWLSEGNAFTGDTLFLAGCGRLFEGSAEMMAASLNDVLGALPDETLIHPGHEYTEKNLRFAASLLPGDDAVAARLASVRALRAEGRPSVPAPLGVERETNPFLRCGDPSLRAALGSADDRAATFAAARARRDVF